MNEFTTGPFSFEPFRLINLNGASLRRWELRYGSKLLADRRVPAAATQAEIVEAFADNRNDFVLRYKQRVAQLVAVPASPQVGTAALVCEATGNHVSLLPLAFWPDDLTAGLTDDRFEYWLVAGSPQCAMPVTLEQFADMQVEHGRLIGERIAHAQEIEALAVRGLQRPRLGWVAEMLPNEVLTDDPAAWRAPTAWEIRHLVGEGSFSSISGAKAATLVGVTPQNFRKYTASDTATTRQGMSFAMWHLLLHKLDVQHIAC